MYSVILKTLFGAWILRSRALEQIYLLSPFLDGSRSRDYVLLKALLPAHIQRALNGSWNNLNTNDLSGEATPTKTRATSKELTNIIRSHWLLWRLLISKSAGHIISVMLNSTESVRLMEKVFPGISS